MKKYIFPLTGIFLIAGICINSCKKDSDPPPTHVGTKTPFTEEFADVVNLNTTGWLFIDNSSSSTSTNGPYASWGQGLFTYDKGGSWYGFSAYSYYNTITEYAYSSVSSGNTNYSVSGWMITPVLSVKNGDKISFYTRGDTTQAFANRMQVRLAKTSSENLGGNSALSTGYYTTVLLDINSSQALNGYPTTWTKFEYTFSGLSGDTDVRIGFRNYLDKGSEARGIGIDQFKFEVN